MQQQYLYILVYNFNASICILKYSRPTLYKDSYCLKCGIDTRDITATSHIILASLETNMVISFYINLRISV